MNISFAHRAAALALVAALAGCGGGSSDTIPTQGAAAPSRAHAPAQSSVLAKIVGVGDSLTAGYQSGGFLGARGVKNPLQSGSAIPPGQENGWWADLNEQASGESLQTAIAHMYDPAVSPLPLIAGPGLDNQIVPAGQFAILGQLKSGDVCTDNGGFDAAGYLRSGLSRTRMNPKSTAIRDLGIPGITLHEANTLAQPQTSTCQALPGVPGLLNQVVADESGTFWPVLGNFAKLGSHLTMVNAAASLHPSLATVWLGANDVLKYMGSGGRFVGGDMTPAQAESDVRAATATLQRAGARVVLANLPNVVETGYFMRMTPMKARLCHSQGQTYFACLLYAFGGGQYIRTDVAKTYHLDSPGCIAASTTKPCGYLTLPGALNTILYYTTYIKLPDLDCPVLAPHCKPVPGSGLGTNYITPAFAAKIQTLNDAVNEGIDRAAAASHVPMVDIATIFHGLASSDPANPYYAQAAAIRPGTCCALGFFNGLLSFDGVHPSNTGYALVASYFIKTINAAYGTSIPQIDVQAVYSGTRCATYCYRDPYAPPFNHVVY